MQKRIRQIAAGKFESDQPSLSISDEELFLTVTEGQEYTGEFEITSEKPYSGEGHCLLHPPKDGVPDSPV